LLLLPCSYLVRASAVWRNASFCLGHWSWINRLYSNVHWYIFQKNAHWNNVVLVKRSELNKNISCSGEYRVILSGCGWPFSFLSAIWWAGWMIVWWKHKERTKVV
jgi:hypothetical protein